MKHILENNKTSVGPSLKTSALTGDDVTAKNLLENQPNPLEVFKRFSFDEVKAALQEYLSDGETQVSTTTTTTTQATPSPAANNYSLDTNKSKSKADQFDDLFSDDNSEGDDLPF